MNTIKLFLLISLAMFLAGCSQGPSPATKASATPGTGAIDPCSLLTKEEIAAVLGQQVTEAKLEGSPRPNCNYPVGDGSVTVFVFNDPSAKGAFETGKTAQDTQTESVNGVGDQAYWSPSIKTLNVLKGNVYFTVQYYYIQSGSLEKMKALAQRAAARLS